MGDWGIIRFIKVAMLRSFICILVINVIIEIMIVILFFHNVIYRI